MEINKLPINADLSNQTDKITNEVKEIKNFIEKY